MFQELPRVCSPCSCSPHLRQVVGLQHCASCDSSHTPVACHSRPSKTRVAGVKRLPCACSPHLGQVVRLQHGGELGLQPGHSLPCRLNQLGPVLQQRPPQRCRRPKGTAAASRATVTAAAADACWCAASSSGADSWLCCWWICRRSPAARDGLAQQRQRLPALLAYEFAARGVDACPPSVR